VIRCLTSVWLRRAIFQDARKCAPSKLHSD
jgi:hypothetical protein